MRNKNYQRNKEFFMADTVAKVFIHYALAIFYQEHKDTKKAEGKKLWSIKKSELQDVLGLTSRLSAHKREQMFEACIKENIGMVELSDRFIFFSPDDIKGLIYDMSPHAKELKALTNEYDALKRSEADRRYEERIG
jgi:hypothetical protein